jgi:hypothetical protein
MGICYPSFLRLASQVPLVIEQNSDDVTEIKSYLGRTAQLYHRMTRSVLLRRSRGMVAVGGEVATKVAGYTQPVLVLGNGISLEKHCTLPPAMNDDPRLVFIGSGLGEWYGLDKIMYLARHFTTWQFDLIGNVKPLSGDLPRNVTFHGYLKGDQYTAILARADVAIGSLAMHRIHIDEISPLKTREYLARGLPTIIGYRDTDFPSAVPYLLCLPNTADNVSANLDVIERFVREWKGQRIPQHLVSHLDSHAKEADRLAFLRTLTSLPSLERVA